MSASGLSKPLQDAVANLLARIDTLELADQLAVIDRSIALEKIKLKAREENYGSAFRSTDEDGSAE